MLGVGLYLREPEAPLESWSKFGDDLKEAKLLGLPFFPIWFLIFFLFREACVFTTSNFVFERKFFTRGIGKVDIQSKTSETISDEDKWRGEVTIRKGPVSGESSTSRVKIQANDSNYSYTETLEVQALETWSVYHETRRVLRLFWKNFEDVSRKSVGTIRVKYTTERLPTTSWDIFEPESKRKEIEPFEDELASLLARSESRVSGVSCFVRRVQKVHCRCSAT
jgi:hypothetical protein